MECGGLLPLLPTDRPYAPVTLLESTLIEASASVESKAFTQTVSPLDATLMKNRGGS
jgi:hypothetical protein